MFGVFISSILRLSRGKKTFVWLFFSAYCFSFLFLGQFFQASIAIVSAIAVLYVSIIFDSRYFPFWKIGDRTKDILSSYSIDRSVRILAAACVLWGSGVGFFVGLEKFESRRLSINAIVLDPSVGQALSSNEGGQVSCFYWSVLLQTSSGFLLECVTVSDGVAPSFLVFIPNSRLNVLLFLESRN